MKLQELNSNEMKNTNGGFLGLGDNTGISLITQGMLGYSFTDDDGDTESGQIDFGLGNMLNIFND